MTQVAPTAAHAEMLSTALVVLDQAEGLAVVEALAGTEAWLVDEDGRSAATSGWRAATGFEALR